MTDRKKLTGAMTYLAVASPVAFSQPAPFAIPKLARLAIPKVARPPVALIRPEIQHLAKRETRL
jgi:hypothetical protein